MKVAVPSEGQDLASNLGERLGLAPYLLVVDLEDLKSPDFSGGISEVYVYYLLCAFHFGSIADFVEVRNVVQDLLFPL